MDALVVGLNNAQVAAVTSPANVLQILAPPGSGKTKTLTSRVAYLIQHHKSKPWNILCLTFTIKSSREMKERLAKLLGNGTEAKLVLGTFHSVCRRYLVSYGHLIGLCKDFGIADSSDSLSIIKRITKRLHLNYDPKLAQARISASKARGIGYADLPKSVTKKKNVDQEEFAQVFEAYEDHLDRADLLDYDDLLLRCCELLRQNPACVSNVEAVLIDEFQDTNLVQFDLMKLFATKQKHITTVGDPDQSIYGWRSAEIKNLKRMQAEFPDTLVIHLEDNYRSSGSILLAAQEVIQQDESRPSKSLLPTHCPGAVPVLRRLPSSDAEASWIVSEIKRSIGMTGAMLDYSDFAILLRSAALSRQIEAAMGRAGIPYRMVGGQKFFDRVEVKILLDYLRVISQPTNNDALARVLNVPARSVGPTTVKALLEEAESKKSTLWSLIRNAIQGNIRTSTKINKPAEQGLGAFVQVVLTAKQKLTSSADPSSPHSLLQYVIKKLRFQEYIKRNYEIDHEGRWANVEELIALATDYPIPQIAEKAYDGQGSSTDLPAVEGINQTNNTVGEETLSAFLANVALSTELQKDGESGEGENQQQVTISTIHAAKGLEWPVVFIPAAYEGSIPHSRAEDTDEERRLLYVAMTRAQALLYISCPVRSSRGEEAVLSQFLNPKSVGHYLVKAGPQFSRGLINDIARILRRSCPLESKVQEEALKLQHSEDDQWSLDGTSDAEQMRSTRDTRSSQVNLQNRQETIQQLAISGKGVERYPDYFDKGNDIARTTPMIGSATTMDARPSFSVHLHGGFTSATNQLQQLKRQQKTQEQDFRVASRPTTASTETMSKPTNRKRMAEDRGQGSLIDAWAIGTQAKDRSMLPSMERSSLATTTAPVNSKPAQISCEHECFLPRTPLMTASDNMVEHRVSDITKSCHSQSQAEERVRPSKRYIFLSSSPPPPDPTQGRSEAQDGPIDSQIGKQVTDDNGTNPSFRDFRPAITAHATSMTEFQTSTAMKKTLGVRRSMSGWKARGVQGFSVPKRLQ
ncbi:MAG: hypothetical protein Q9220_001461 [cf. Caloplaca sp. 1 TL-2023]